MARADFLPWRPRVLVRVSRIGLALRAPRGQANGDEPLGAFDAAAAEPALARFAAATAGAALDVVVDAGLAQLWMLPYSPSLTSEARWRNFAVARFEQMLGPADGFRIDVAPAAPPHPRLAAALPAWLPASLGAAFGRRLRSVRIDALERLGAVVGLDPRFSGAAIDVGTEGAWLFLFLRGRLLRVRRRRVSGHGAEALAAAVAGDLRSEWSAVADGVLPALRAAWHDRDPQPLVDALRARSVAAQVNGYV